MSFKRARVMLIPTEKATCLFISNGRLANYHKPQLGDGKDVVNYELYIISDDEIKKDDWCYDEYNKTVFKNNSKGNPGASKKIIASTNENMYILHDNGVLGQGVTRFPQPSQAFIEKYVKQYNKGNIITDVLVEYGMSSTPINNTISIADYIHDFKPKVNSKDNTITIRKLKDSWSRDEVENLLWEIRDFHLNTPTSIGGYSLEYVKEKFKTYIEENL